MLIPIINNNKKVDDVLRNTYTKTLHESTCMHEGSPRIYAFEIQI